MRAASSVSERLTYAHQALDNGQMVDAYEQINEARRFTDLLLRGVTDTPPEVRQ